MYIVGNMTRYGVFSGPYFPPFRLKMEIYSVNLRIQSECGKIRTRNSLFGHLSRYRVIKNISNKTNTNLYSFFKLFKFFSIVFRGIILEEKFPHASLETRLIKPTTLLKKRLWQGCFLVNFVKFLRTPFLQNNSGRLLLHFTGFYMRK